MATSWGQVQGGRMNAKEVLKVFINLFAIADAAGPDHWVDGFDVDKTYEAGLWLSEMVNCEDAERKKRNVEAHYEKQIKKLQKIRDDKLKELNFMESVQ